MRSSCSPISAPYGRWESICATTEDLLDHIMKHPTPRLRFAALHSVVFTLLHRLTE